ncbi:MAG: hypothetical protein ACOH10_11635 [Rhodoglobus sp.]
MLTYRSVMEVSQKVQLENLVRGELNAWLDSKGYDSSSLSSAWQELAPGTGAVQLEYPVGGDGAVRVRLHLAEASGWGTLLTFSAGGGKPGWLWVDVHSPDGRPAGVPRIVRNLLPLIDARDGLARLEERSKLVRVEDIPDLIDVLCDPYRRGVVFVAGTAVEQPGKAWRQLVDNLARETIGLAATYLLDSEATSALGSALGSQYATAGGTVRSYLPGVDPASISDSRRHRMLGAERLSGKEVHAARRLLAGVARIQALHAPLPREVTKVDRLLDRLQTTELVSSWQSPRGRHLVALAAPKDVVDSPTALVAPTAPTFLPPGPRPSTTRALTPAPRPEPPVVSPATPTTPEVPLRQFADLPPAELEPPLELESPQGPAQEPDPDAPNEVADVRDVEVHLAIVAGAARIFGDDDLTPELVDKLVALAEESLAAHSARVSVEQRLDLLQTRLETSEDRERLSADQADEAQQDFALSQYENNALVDKVLHLQRALAKLDNAEAGWSDVPEQERTIRPETFEQLVGCLGTLEGVVFTGSKAITLDLDTHDMLGTLAGKTWDLLLVLRDYAAVKATGRFEGGLTDYLRNTPPGCRSYSLNQFASAESETVRNRNDWHGERVFRVPTSVEADGRLFMGAHFRLSAKRSVSPRVYVHDATRKDGKVYVGYIGRHLENTRS